MKQVNRTNKKIVSFLTMAAMVAPLFIVGTVNVKAKDIDGNWAKTEIDKLVALGIVKGYPDGTFKPEDSITRAEFITIVNGAFNFIEKSDNIFNDVKENAWYADGISKAVYAGILAGDGTGNVNPDAPITREASAAILQRVFNLQVQDKEASDIFSDADKISYWAKDSISAMVENGYLSGRPGNVIVPLDKITRAESIKMIDNVMGDLKNVAGTYTGTIEGNLIVNTENVVLKDMIINGNLYLTEGIGDGDVTLERVIVKGQTYVTGGGENSIIIKDSLLEGKLNVRKADGKVRIVAMGSTEISKLQLNSGATIEEKELTGKGFSDIEVVGTLASSQKITLSGDFEEVSIKVPDTNIQLVEGIIEKLLAFEEAEEAKITINNEAIVKELIANAEITVSGNGTVENAIINAQGVAIEQKPINTTVAEGITADVAGVIVTEGTTTTPTTTTPTTTPSSSGSGSSSSQVSVTGINITSENNVTTVVTGQTVKMSATVTPTNATNRTVTWSVEPLSAATIDATTGLLTATAAGTVIVKAVANDGSLSQETKLITVKAKLEAVNLGTAGNYAILSKTGISSSPNSVVTGNIAVSPIKATAITGFSLTKDSTNEFATSAQVTGAVYASDYTSPTPINLTTAVSNMETAYTDAAGRASNYTELYTGDLSGQTLVAGVYKWGTGVLINKDVTLNGGANDVWIFQIDKGITQANDTKIILTGGAQAKNIFWQSAQTVAIGSNAHFEGTIIGMTNISLGTNASITGRLLAQTAVTLDASTVVDPTFETVLEPSAVATLISTIGTVDNVQSTIVAIPNETTLADFKAGIKQATGATFEVYAADGITVATDLASNYKVIVTAQDKLTKKTYTVTVQ